MLLSLHKCPASFGAHQYSLIGGKVDVEESPSNALIREVAEEVGIKITIDDLQMGTFPYFIGVKETCAAFTFRVTKWQGKPYNKEPEKQEMIKSTV